MGCGKPAFRRAAEIVPPKPDFRLWRNNSPILNDTLRTKNHAAAKIPEFIAPRVLEIKGGVEVPDFIEYF
jgi:hypothetical protein